MSDLIGEHNHTLQALDQNEFYDVWKQQHPLGTRDEFDAEWGAFQTAKAEHINRMRLN